MSKRGPVAFKCGNCRQLFTLLDSFDKDVASVSPVHLGRRHCLCEWSSEANGLCSECYQKLIEVIKNWTGEQE